MSIGESIRKHRREKQLTQTQLADMVGVSESMICQLERGTKTLTVPLGNQIAEALGVPLLALIGQHDSEQAG